MVPHAHTPCIGSRALRALTVPLVFAGLLSLASGALAPAARAITIVNVTGSGDLTLNATGTIYFDASDLDATDIVLAGDEIVIGVPLPAGIPGTPDATLDLMDAMNANTFSIVGDVYFGTLEYTGSVTFSAPRIHASSGLSASGSITLDAATGLIVGGPIGAGTGCGTSSGGIIAISSPTSGSDCPIAIITPPLDGGIIVVVPPVIGAPVPEPSSALLFAIGVILMAARFERR